MKTSRFSRLTGAAVGSALVALLMGSCDTNLVTTDGLPPLNPASLDSAAGDWRMILLAGPEQVAVAAPADTTTDTYKAEVAAIKSAQSKLTEGQRSSIAYWGGGGVLRWNQVMRELVARYNLPPAPNGSSYPAPDPENPFADPNYPFANPPYAARAYSYVSAAMYDALKAAWHYKFLYGRRSPAKNDPGVQALVPISDLPSYPSEEAVMSGVAVEMLKLLFPASVEEITLKAAEERNAALWSGKATASDIAAGLALGKAIAAVFIARAGTDGMKTAAGSPALWQSYVDTAVARGEIPWTSLEDPKRPPMLANFGKVAGWLMTPADFVAERPDAPPSTHSDEMAAELAEVKRTVDNATRKQLAIVQFWADGAATATPPGHWNAIASEYVRDAALSEVRAARVFALLNVTMHDVAVACWEAKFYYFNPRPSQLDPSIKTLTGLPNFPSFPSGHSTFSAAAAEILSYFFPNGTANFEAMRDEAAISRLYGGIHYRSDVEGGKEHGARIGAYAIQFLETDGADQ